MGKVICKKNLYGIVEKRIDSEKNIVYKNLYKGIRWACFENKLYSGIPSYLKAVIDNPFNDPDVIICAKNLLLEFGE